MKSTFAGLAAAALFALSGCAAESEGMSAQYPPAPPPAPDTPPTDVAAAESTSAPVPVQVQANVDDNAQAYSQPQSGDIQVGVDGDDYADTDPAALTDFKPALDPYGTWYEDASYGTVWVPSSTVVGSDFAPYVTAGHWAYEDDYVWVSDYSWGWAPFHYGRWVYIGGRGWGWIPGRTYAGAWVTWRHGYDGWGYVGWAPMPPTWYWHGGYAVGIGYVPPAPYVFCHSSHVFHPYVGRQIVTGSQVPVVASHTRPYVPASPTVGGPGGPGGRVGAHPTVGGPPPKVLGLNAGQVPHVPANHVGLLHAQHFSKPTTAQTLGARPPQQIAHPVGAPNAWAGASRSSFAGAGGQTRVPQTTIIGAPHSGAVATSPQYRGITPSAPRPSPYSAPTRVPSAASPAPFAPSVRSPASPYASTPSYHAPTPSYHTPTPSYHAPTPSYHAPAPSHAAPSFHSSSPSVSRPSSGGFHGGGSVSRGRR